MQPLYTADGFRFIQEKTVDGGKLNWIFLPGGPGLGSEYFKSLFELINLPGVTWRLDFLNDGSNRLNKDIDYEFVWSSGLINAVQTFDNVILVTHSFSGMFALTLLELENHLKGFVIMNSTPNKDWADGLAQRIKQNNFINTSDLQEKYWQDQTDDNLKDLMIACWQLLVNNDSKSKIQEIMTKDMQYNAAAYAWGHGVFHKQYQAKWIPQKINTLIIGGDQDILTPFNLFKKDERFVRDNITMEEIKNASHFLWIDQPEPVIKLFQDFATLNLKCITSPS